MKKEEESVCLNVSGIEIYFTKNEKGIYTPGFTDACGIDDSLFDKLEYNENFELHKYMFKIFSKYNYSPIINKINNGKKETHENLLNETFIWTTYISNYKCCNLVYDINIFKNIIVKIYISFINEYLLHIFSIPKISECLNILNKKIKFVIYNFSNINKNENDSDNEIYLDIEKELKGNGCTFLFLKDIKSLYDCLILSSNYLK